MSNDFKEKCKVPENYKKAIDRVVEVNQLRRECIDQTLKLLAEKNASIHDIEQARILMETIIETGAASFELSEEEMVNFLTPLTITEQKNGYMRFIKDQAKGFFLILELIKEQILLLIENEQINKDYNVEMLARIKGLDSAVNNEISNKGKLEGKLKIIDDVFGITIIANDKTDVQTIRKHISNSLIKVTKAKTINKSIKDKDGNQQPGYNAYHDMGYLNDVAFEWIKDINVDRYKAQVEECLKEDNKTGITLQDLDEIDKKIYQTSEELPIIEIHYQTYEEYERANGIASHEKYKQANGIESMVFIQQKYLHEEFHRFIDLPIMFEWKSRDDEVRLLNRDETLFTMYPYLKQLQAKREEMTH